MKKSIKLFGLILFAPLMLGGLASAKAPLRAADPETSISEPAPEVASCSVVVESNEHGKITLSSTEGNVGDIVVIEVEPKAFYLVESISVNGTVLTVNEEGKYQFALAEGENKVSVKYVIDEKLLGEFATLAEQISQKDWKNVFSLQNILLIVNYLINSGIAFALVRLVGKYRKSKTVDRKDIIDTINTVLPKEANAIIQKTINDNLVPLITPVISQMGGLEESMKTFIKAFLYSIEGTPDAKDKIISLLSNLKLSDNDTVKEIQTWLANEIAKIQAESEKNKQLLEEMKKTNSDALKRVGIYENNEELTQEPRKEDDDYDGTSI